ncbi:MAG: FAD-dependent oxidoreductase, partial [Phycisphaerae bacterium]
FSMAPLGVSHFYADGDYAAQARVWKLHQDYLRGLYEFMRTDARVPETYRKEVAAMGLDRRHHPDTAGWPNQLYVRIARRVKGDYTVTAHDVYNKTKVEDSIGLAQYGIDTYPSRRIPVTKDGKQYVGIEGKMFVGGNRGPTDTPYPISYRAIRPKSAECTNLLVPVSFSATHLGYASARMEPVFMIAGEAAGHAAALAISLGVSVQDVPYDQLARRMKADNHRLSWEPAYAAERDKGKGASAPATPIKLDGIAVDDDAAEFTGEWTPSTRSPQFVGKGYRHAKAGGLATATYTAKLPAPGKYEVRLYFSADHGRATAVPVTVKHAGGEASVKVDQSQKPAGGTYQALGTFAFEATGTVVLSNDKADGYVIADAVEFVAAK